MMSIALHGETPPQVVAAENVYFPFASGRLAYDCAGCGATCCKGHGYQSCRGAELDTQLRIRPEVRFFVDATTASAAMVRVRNFSPACFFLAADNRCDIHRAHGMAAKPETCRFFPFNQFMRVDDHLLVLPHPAICPLFVTDAIGVHRESDHAALLDAMAERGIAARPLPAVVLGGSASAIVRRERRIVAAAASFSTVAGYEPFAARQLALERSGDVPPASDDSDAAQTEIAAFSELLWTVLDASKPVDDPVVTGLAIALSPLVRAYVVFRAADATAARTEMDDERLPFFLTAAHALAMLASKAGTPMTYQTMTQLFRDAHQLLAMLAYLDTVVVWRTQGEALAADRDAAAATPETAVVAALRRPVQESRQLRFGDVLCAHAPAGGIERVLFLKRLARLLCGRIVRLTQAQSDSTEALPAALTERSPRRRFEWRLWRPLERPRAS